MVGVVDFAGLDVYDLGQGVRRECIDWKILEALEIRLHDPTIQAVASLPAKGLLFVSFESGQKNANTILLIDTESFQLVVELGPFFGRRVLSFFAFGVSASVVHHYRFSMNSTTSLPLFSAESRSA